jgi:nucleotide-binding universal stress UspA family protein
MLTSNQKRAHFHQPAPPKRVRFLPVNSPLDYNPGHDVAEKEDIKVEALTRKGEPYYEVMVNTAEKKNAGFMVVGSHGKSGIERLFMGSVTERVIGQAGCPILVVRKP